MTETHPVHTCRLCGSENTQPVSEVYDAARNTVPPKPIAQRLRAPSVARPRGPLDIYWDRSTRFVVRYLTPGGCAGIIIAPIFALFIPWMVWGGLVILIVARGDLDNASPAQGILALVLNFLLPIGLVFWDWLEKRKIRRDLTVSYPGILEQWEKLRYCHDCDRVYAQDTGEMFIDEHEIIPLQLVNTDKILRPLWIEDKSQVQVEFFHPAELPDGLEPVEIKINPDEAREITFSDPSKLCWYCETNPAEEGNPVEIKLFGNERQVTRPGMRPVSVWDTATLEVARCMDCRKKHHKIRYLKVGLALLVVILSPALCVLTLLPKPPFYVPWLITFAFILIVIFGGLKWIAGVEKGQSSKTVKDSMDKFPLAVELMGNGWLSKKETNRQPGPNPP